MEKINWDVLRSENWSENSCFFIWNPYIEVRFQIRYIINMKSEKLLWLLLYSICISKYNKAVISVCLSIGMSDPNSWTHWPFCLKFCLGNFGEPLKCFYLKLFYFVKFWKCAKKYYEILKFLTTFFLLYKRRMLTDKATIKSWKRRWAGSALKAYSCK